MIYIYIYIIYIYIERERERRDCYVRYSIIITENWSGIWLYNIFIACSFYIKWSLSLVGELTIEGGHKKYNKYGIKVSLYTRYLLFGVRFILIIHIFFEGDKIISKLENVKCT